MPGMFANMNAGDPTKWTYEADLTRQSRQRRRLPDRQNLRLTMQATPRNKFSVFWDEQMPCKRRHLVVGADGCRNSRRRDSSTAATATIAPEAGGTLAPEAPAAVSRQVPARAAGDVVVADDQPAAARGRLRHLSEPLRLERTAGQPDARLVRVTEQCAAGCAVNGSIAGLIYRSQNWEYNWNWRAHVARVGLATSPARTT